jgi:DNA-nicking Smr family endonuclease
MSRGRKRTPSDEEDALWEHVKRTVMPLQPHAKRAAPEKKPREEPAPALKPRKPAAALPPVPPPKAKPKPPPALSPMDRRTMSRITRGAVAIDGRIDLHGMTQASAHHRLIDYLHGAQASGAKVVLVITGKGSPDGSERGVLRRVVPVWLSSAELRPLVIGFDEAGRGHGGSGALYVRLRRKR